MFELWKGVATQLQVDNMQEVRGCEFINIHTAIEGEYQFLLGASIIKFEDKYRVTFGNSYRGENDDNTIVRELVSLDGRSFKDEGRLSDKDEGFGRSHGVYFEQNGKLYFFCPKARFKKIDTYPDLKMEAYTLNGNSWINLGIVLDDFFWPMCEPIRLKNGRLIMAGLKTKGGKAAVALSNGNVTQWKMIEIPNPKGYAYWGETTVLPLIDRLIALSRGGAGTKGALVSESFDGGETWSGLDESNLLIDEAKIYAGKLSTGKSYLIFNARTGVWRDSLCIAIGNECFEKIYIIKHGFDRLPRFWGNNEWAYPYAYEADGKLRIVYARNKEDCEMAVIPVESFE